MTKDQALKLALEALEKCRTYHQQEWSIEETTKPEVKQAITAIKEALELPQRTWQGLTHEEIDYIYTGIRAVHHDVDSDVLCRAIEARLKEKNT